MTRVLVTGVRGKTGVPLADLLAARPDVEVLGGSSDPATVASAVTDGVRPIAFSWDRPGTWAAALDGVDAAYVVRPDRADAPGLVEALLAASAPRTRVVLLSGQDAVAVEPGAWAREVERAVRDSGRSWTVLRPSWFMQVFTDPRMYREPVVGGSLPFVSGDAQVAWIDTRDIAAVAGRALLEPGHDEQVYELTGPEALSLPRTAELLSLATGRPVEHRDVSLDDAAAGTTGFERELTVLTFEQVRAGVYSAVTDAVERVTGRPARSLAAFVDDVGADLCRQA